MKRASLILLALLVVTPLAHGQPAGNALLWKISGNGLEKPSYLYGTFHLLCPEQLQLQEILKKALSESDRLVLELDFDNPEVMTTVQKGMVFLDGTSARDYLSEEEYDLVASFFTTQLQVPFDQISFVKPFFLSAMSLFFYLDCQPESLEMKLTELAGGYQIEVQGIETVEEQLGFIEDIPLEDQKKMLLEVVESREEMKAMTDQMVQTYLKGDLDGLQSILDEYMSGEYAEMNEGLVTGRNKSWISKIEELARESPSFIAVGAGHLPGKEGVIQLLKSSGFTVEIVR
jgi:uncharacterized protein YbaP (TraB family)